MLFFVSVRSALLLWLTLIDWGGISLFFKADVPGDKTSSDRHTDRRKAVSSVEGAFRF